MAKPHPLLDPTNFRLSVSFLLLVAIAGGLATEVVKWEEPLRYSLLFTLALVLIVVLGSVLSRRMARPEITTLGILKNVLRAKGLVVLVSKPPGGASAMDAALQNGVLEHFWLLHSADTKPDALWIAAELAKAGSKAKPHYCEILDVWSIIEAKDIVDHVRRTAKREYGLADKDLICDFTGMTKHVSAGMIFAGAPMEARLQYMHPKNFLANGHADQAAGSTPLEVQIAYQVEEEL